MTEKTTTISNIAPEKLVDYRMVMWHFWAALLFLFINMVAGLLVALQLVSWNPLNGIEIFSPGRWRMVHTNAVAYGFLANAFLGVMHWVIPRLTLRTVLHPLLSMLIFIAWQIVVLATAVGILFGEAQAVEWGETPVWIDPVALLGLFLVALNFMPPIARSRGPMYVTNWYFLAMFIWTFLTYAMGNFIPQYVSPGTAGGAVAGLFIHDLVGLFVTPLGWGSMYFFVPILLKKPMWSHGLSLVGFWGLAFFYPLQGIHHFLYTPIPMFLQYGAVISTIAVELVVFTVIVNFFGTLYGNGREVFTNIPLRWFYFGMVNYFITCFQCALQVTMTFQEMIHFSDWVVGHAHLVMFGVFTIWLMGIMTYLIPRLTHREWYSKSLLEWHFWLSAGSITVMFLDLTLAGIFQGYHWVSLNSWDVSTDVSHNFWVVRIFAGLGMFGGLLCFIYNIYKTMQQPISKSARVEA
jgi:cytochrome c oxidase cbb3-type subunit I